MKIRKLMSLILALAMVISVVPVLGITASAAATWTGNELIAAAGELVFDGSMAKIPISTGWATNAPVADNWTGWSVDETYGTANLQGYPVNGQEMATLQFYKGGPDGSPKYAPSGQMGSDVSFFDNAESNTALVKVNSPTYGNNTGFVVLDFYFKVGNTDACYHDYYFRDANGVRIGPAVRMDINNVVVADSASARTTVGAYITKNTDNADKWRVIAVNNGDNYDFILEKNGSAIYSKTYDGSFNGFGGFDVIMGYYNGQFTHSGLAELKVYAGETPDKDTSVTAEVISGNTPILPATVRVKNADGGTTTENVTWDYASSDFTASATRTESVTGTTASGETVIAQVTVYPMTFTMQDQISYNGNPGNNVYLPVNLTGVFSMEFDLFVNDIKNASVQIGKDGAVFGDGQIGLGIGYEGNSYGDFTPTSGKGDGSGNIGAAITKVEAGKTYRIFLTIDPSNNSYTSVLTKEDGSKYEGGTRYFRTNANYINTIHMLTNWGGADGDLKISNVKFYAPGVTVTPYTVHFDGVDREDEIVYPREDEVKALPVNAYLPRYVIPYIEGYVFSDYSLNGTTYTLTYAESTDSLGTWYTRNNLSEPTVSLNKMHFLGAHDAFTVKIATSTVGDAAGSKTNDAGSRSAIQYPTTAQSTSITQEVGAYGLLNAGVRYFDIRLSVSDDEEPNTKYGALGILSKTVDGTNGEYYTTHGLLAQPFKTVLYTIRDFCKENPGEVIVLDFQTLYNALDKYGEGAAANGNWDDVYNLMVETGVSEFMVSGATSPSGHTWASMTNNGQHAAVVCFGQTVSQGTQSAHFIGANSRRSGNIIPDEKTGGYQDGSGYLYSYYNEKAPSSYKNLLTDIQNNQVGNIDPSAVWPFRIMQAIWGTSPVSNARSTTADLINEPDFKTWIQTLPVVMMDNAALNTTNYLELFATFNRDGSDEIYTAKVEGVTVEGPSASVPFSTKLTAVKSGRDYTFTLTQYEDKDTDITGEVTLTFPDATGGITGLRTVVYHNGEKLETTANGNGVDVKTKTIRGTFTVTTEAANGELDAKLGAAADGTLTIDFPMGDVTSSVTGADSFNVTVTDENNTVVGSGTLPTDNPNVILTPADSNVIYTATLEAVKNGVSYAVASIRASLYSEVVENLKALSGTYTGGTDKTMIAKANAVITHGGVYFTSTDGTGLTKETTEIISVTNGADSYTVTVNTPYSTFGIGFVLDGNTVCIGSIDRTFENAESGKAYDTVTVNKADRTVTLSSGEEVIVLSLDAVNIEFIETAINESEAAGAGAEFDFIPEL